MRIESTNNFPELIKEGRSLTLKDWPNLAEYDSQVQYDNANSAKFNIRMTKKQING